ncbi:type VII secretion protein EccC [Mycobacterium noviomagense]|uniref:Type VII secretion protein EccC n=1 Tax=Mycobacterium noviomagense TaxID=459858 RepID=A0ABX3T576_9MYCO|nr:type VII secretion protein EccC [Mycobacterium noviomagense]
MPPPTFSTDEITVAPPPTPTGPARNSLLIRLLPVVMAVATVGMMAAAFGSRSAISRNPVFLAFPAMMLISAVITALAGRDSRRTAELDRDRADYLSYLSGLRGSVVKTAAAQCSSLMWRHPDPESLWTLIGGPRMWERRPADADFGQVRIGTGIRPIASRLVPPDKPSERMDPVTVSALHRFLGVHSTIASAPASIGLRGAPTVTIDGDPANARALLRAMICQLAVLHAPDQLLIPAAISDAMQCHWEWLKWLPHNQHPDASDEGGPARMQYRTLAELDAAVGDLLGQRLVVAVVDGDIESRAATPGLTVLKVGAGDAGQLRLRVSATAVTVREADRHDVVAQPDQLDAGDALVCAQRLSAYRLDRSSGDSTRAGCRGWQHLLGIDDFAFDPSAHWRTLNYRDRLRVPIGTTVDGTPLELDIKEAAEQGMGPHGLCIGATGSGKSELLRTVALGMLARHSPEILNLVLIDFKGGATFLGLERAPHVAAVITNLSDEAALVARMSDALAGEINRRQQMLRRAGNLVSVDAYEHARRAGAQLAALPTLFIIVDEYSELLRQHPDFAETFAAIGRLGRSLGMHLLLASQRLDEGRLRGLESHLSYRICLKTLSANDSRVVLGKPDAFELPNIPGAGFLQTASAESIRFQTAFVSGPCRSDTVHCESCGGHGTPVVRVFTAAPMGPVTATHVDRVGQMSARTVLQAVVDGLSRCGPAAHQVWLPPLGAAPALDSVLRAAGLTVGDAASSDLTVPIGVVDRPYEQQRTPLTVDLSAAAGNVAVVGGPQSGKSTTLRALIVALAATHDPGRVQFYCLDFGGGALESMRCLPHVGSVAGRAQPDLVMRTVAELESIIQRREPVFRERGIESMARYRRLRCEQPTTAAGDRFGDVFLVVDGWAVVRQEFPVLEESIIALAAQGLSFGVHVVVSASRWADIRPGLKDQLGARIELRLGDPADSEVDRKQAQRVPKDRPGRGLTADGLHMVIALPRLDGIQSSTGLAEAAVQVGEVLRRRYGEAGAAPVPLLPAHVEHQALLERASDELREHILLGLEEHELHPCPCDFGQQQHLLVLGDNQCGKSAALRTLCREITRTKTAAQARVVIVDFRRSLLNVVESEHFAGYAVSAQALERLLAGLLTVLKRRMPPPQATQQQLRARSWWAGPDLYLVVDDYDLVANAAGNPLATIVEFLPYARDLGLHLLVARRSGGAARAVFEPLLAGLRELGCMGLMMSADSEEGPLIGSVRPTRLPPGRGTLVTRGRTQKVQVAWSPPP